MSDEVGVYLDQDVDSGSLWKVPDRLGSGTAWICGWLNEGLRGWGNRVSWRWVGDLGEGDH